MRSALYAELQKVLAMSLPSLFEELWREIELWEKDQLDEARSRTTVDMVASWVSRLEAQGDLAETALRNHLAEAENEKDERIGALSVALVIDQWFLPLNEKHPKLSENLKKYRQKLILDGSLVDGCQLILSRPQRGYWSDVGIMRPIRRNVSDIFHNLLLLPSSIPSTSPHDKYSNTSVRVAYRCLPSENVDPYIDEWKIGFAPLAQLESDIDFSLLQKGYTHYYDVRPNDISARLEDVIRILCADNVSVIVFPEMTIDSRHLHALKAAIKSHGPGTRLRLVIAGVRHDNGPDSPPNNMACLFNEYGDEIYSQNKLSCWDLTQKQRQRFELESPSIPPEHLLCEYISPGEVATVVEMDGLGRLSVMICEDLTRSQPGMWLRDHLLLDWIFNPILDGGLFGGAWPVQEAIDIAKSPGICRVVVANSMPLTYRQNRAWKDTTEAVHITDTPGIAAYYDPMDAAPAPAVQALPLQSVTALTTTILVPGKKGNGEIIN